MTDYLYKTLQTVNETVNPFAEVQEEPDFLDRVKQHIQNLATPLLEEVGSDVERAVLDKIEKNVEGLATQRDNFYQYADPDALVNLVRSWVSDEIGTPFVPQIISGSTHIDRREEDEFLDLYRKCQYWKKVFGSKKRKNLVLVALGGSQTGKSTTIKKAFGLKKIQIKNGMKSDTDDVIEHVIGDFVFVDTPGFFDSRGEQQQLENLHKIVLYLQNNPVDLFVFFFKISDIADQSAMDVFHFLRTNVGDDVFNRAVIVLTHANDKAPEFYYDLTKTETDSIEVERYYDSIDSFNRESESESESESEFGEVTENVDDEAAWCEYVNARKEMWTDALGNLGYDGIPIVLVENNRHNAQFWDNDYRLVNGDPIYQTFMETMLLRVSKFKGPALFTILAGDVENIERNRSLSTFSESSGSLLDEGSSSSSSTAPKKMKTSTNRSNDKPKSKINNRQKVVKRAADNVNKNKTGGWCTIL